MNRRTDHEELLADVIGEGFDTAVLGETLKHVRRRRQRRNALRAGAVMALALVAGLLLWPRAPRRNVPVEIASPEAAPKSYELVVSRALTGDEIIGTQPLSPEQIVAPERTVTIVFTRTGGFREVGDDELLKLAAPQIAALVRRGPHDAELVLLPLPETSEQ